VEGLRESSVQRNVDETAMLREKAS